MSGTAAIIGAGLIGRAWAIAFARGGWNVRLWDADPAVPARSLSTVEDLLADMASFDLLGGRTPAEITGRITPVESLQDALEGVDWVQESAPERLEVKQKLWAEMDPLTPVEAVMGSSTSALKASSFTESLAHRERCLVVHPLNPPYLIPAVELMPAPWTSMETFVKAEETIRAIGQKPIRVNREIDGFIMNRLQAALVEEAMKLVGNGICSVEDVDIGLREGLALRWSFIGPYEVADLNAPAGVREYFTRYASVFESVRDSPLDRPDWTGPLLDEIEEQRRIRLLRDQEQLAARQRWRDRRLMALMAHKHKASADIGD